MPDDTCSGAVWCHYKGIASACWLFAVRFGDRAELEAFEFRPVQQGEAVIDRRILGGCEKCWQIGDSRFGGIVDAHLLTLVKRIIHGGTRRLTFDMSGSRRRRGLGPE